MISKLVKQRKSVWEPHLGFKAGFLKLYHVFIMAGHIPEHKVTKNQIGRALYKQVKDYILDLIRSGTLQLGSRIPSESELMYALGVSRMTAHRAVRELAEEGYLVRSQGVGTFVSMHRSQGALIEIKSIAEEIHNSGGQHSCRVVLQREEPASQTIADAIEIIQGKPVYHTILIHRDNDLPVLHADRYVNPAVAPDYILQDFSAITPTEYLVSVAPVEEAEHTVESLLPDIQIRRLLKMRECESCLVLHRKTWSFGKVATVSKLTYPGNRFRLSGRFKTGSISVASPA